MKKGFGGVVFAPTPRDYSFKLNKKEKIAALKSALTSRVQDGKIYVMDELAFGEIKTKKMADVLKGLGVQKAFIVTNDVDKNVFCSARNIPNVKTGFITKVNTTDKKTGEEKELLSSTLNVYDILKYNNLVITKAAVELIEEVYA